MKPNQLEVHVCTAIGYLVCYIKKYLPSTNQNSQNKHPDFVWQNEQTPWENHQTATGTTPATLGASSRKFLPTNDLGTTATALRTDSAFAQHAQPISDGTGATASCGDRWTMEDFGGDKGLGGVNVITLSVTIAY